MKIIIFIWCFISISTIPIVSNELGINAYILGTVINGRNVGELIFNPGRGGGPTTPNCFIVDEFKKKIIAIERTRGAFVYYSLSMKFIREERLNNDIARFAYSQKMIQIKNQDIYIGSHRYRIRLMKNFEEMVFESSKKELWGNRTESTQNYFVIGDYIFYYDSEGFARTLDFKANFLSKEDDLKKLKEYNKEYIIETGLADRISSPVTGMLNSGKSIILGDRYYSTDFRENCIYYNLFEEGSNLKFSYNNVYNKAINVEFIGYDEEHNSYWNFLEEPGKKLVIMYSKYGELLASYYYQHLFIGYTTDVRPTIYVTESGNLYFMFPHQDGTRFYKVNRTWGEPSLVAVATNGLEGDSYSKYVMEVLATMDKDQLRILRNTMFAMEGYKFKSEELTVHFNQYEWYKPNESVQASASNLSEAQQKLIEEIRRLEQE